MAEPLLDLLSQYLDAPVPVHDGTVEGYLKHLQSLPLTSLATSETEDLAQHSHSLLLALQSLSTKANASVISSADHLSIYSSSLPVFDKDLTLLQSTIPSLDDEISKFGERFSKSSDNPLLERRRKAMLLERNVDRLSDILELPSLLSSAIQSSSSSINSSQAGGQTSALNYTSALDLHAHIKRIHVLYPNSALVSSVSKQADDAMQTMTVNLISSLRTSNIKLAGGIRTIGWLRRIAPDLEDTGSKQGALGSLFLICRLANLITTLNALDPLRELADQESRQSPPATTKSNGQWAGGQQTEKYLKRFIEVFREHSFAIISMYRSIFPSDSEDDGFSTSIGTEVGTDKYQRNPLALASFTLHLVDLLAETLKGYLPNVRDQSSRESLYTQVLYCAGSLGRLGGDFGMVLGLIDDAVEQEVDSQGGLENEHWVEVIRKHRVLAGRLELLANGVAMSSGSQSPLRELSK